MKKVAIILVNYKDYAKRFLDECRDSLRAQNYPPELMKVYIVDNASGEESKKYLEDNFKEAEIITREDGNYSAANNAGIKKSLADGCEYFAIVNMDVKFDSDWLMESVRAIEENTEAGIVQSKILLYPKNEAEWANPKINTLGNLMHYLGFGATSFYNEPDREIDGLPEIGGYASGCSFIIKKEVLEKIGGYNEEYYMYHDDIEMSWKAKLAGYKIILAPKSVVYHKYEFERSVRMLYYMERNRYLTIFIFYDILTLLLIMPALVLMELGMIVYSIVNGWFKTKINIWLYFLRLSVWIKIIKSRKNIKLIRKKAEHEIVNSFSGLILFQEIANPVLKYIANPILNFYWQIVKKVIIW